MDRSLQLTFRAISALLVIAGIVFLILDGIGPGPVAIVLCGAAALLTPLGR